MFHSFSVHHLAMYVQALILLVLNAERYQYSLWRKDRPAPVEIVASRVF